MDSAEENQADSTADRGGVIMTVRKEARTVNQFFRQIQSYQRREPAALSQ